MIWTTQPRFKTELGLSGYCLGDGPNLVLLHGVGLRSEAWNSLVAYLSDSFSIYAIDLPGHGESESLEGDASSLEDYSDAITAYLESFDGPVYIAGHSMGAMIAINIAINHPERVKSIAALNAIYKRSDIASKAVKARAEALRGIAQKNLNTDVTLQRWFGENPESDSLDAAKACDGWIRKTPIMEYQKAYHCFAHHDGPSAKQLPKLKVPSLFITGADEPNSTPEMSQAMAQIVPLGRAEIIRGAAHMMPMTHAEQVATVLRHHFKE